MRRRTMLVTLGVAGALAAFEAALQAIALFVWLGAGPAADGGDGPTALCVGDSFTYGLGASTTEDAWPAVAERACAAAGRPIGFINGGWAGQTSRDVLLRLPRQLNRHRPALVYVWVGTNDLWQHPAEVTPDELAAARAAGGDDGFPWRWRTRRFARLVADWWRGDGDRAAPPFAGAWHTGDTVVWFGEDGRLWLDGVDGQWVLEDGDLFVVGDSGWRQPIEWSIDNDQLRMRVQAWPTSLTLQRGAPDTAREAPRRAAAAGDLHHALREELAHRRAGPGDRAAATLGRHLDRIIELCRDAGAIPVLLTYPGGAFAKPAVQACHTAVARRSGIELLSTHAMLGVENEDRAEPHYVADGHLSSRGYALVGQAIASHAQTTLAVR